MFVQSNPKLVANYQNVCRVSNMVGGIAGALVLIGWLFKLPMLRDPLPGQIPLTPLAASLFVLSSIACWQLIRQDHLAWNRRVATICATLIIFAALSVLLTFGLNWWFDLEILLFHHYIPEIHYSYLARMAPNTATAFLLAGSAIFLLGQRKQSYYFAAHFLAILVAVISFFALVGYCYGVPLLYGVASYTQMALQSAIMLMLMALSIFFVEPDKGAAVLLTSTSAGGIMARRLLPAAILAPLIFGWLRVLGEREGLFAWDFGTAVLILLMIITAVIVVAINAKYLDNLDAERERLLMQRENLTAVLTHDLKNPLIAADRLLQLFITGAVGAITAEQAKLLGKLKHSNEELLNNIQILLELYRYDRGIETMRFDDVDLIPIIQKCVEETKILAEGHGLELIVILPESLGTVRADQMAIKHVIINLLHNAMKFTAPGGSIEISAQDLGDNLVIKVKDTGKGIPKDEQEILFQPFSQGKLGKKYKTGTGLGLYLCHQIIKDHLGFLACSSEVGVGTTFIINLPIKSNSVQQSVIELK